MHDALPFGRTGSRHPVPRGRQSLDDRGAGPAGARMCSNANRLVDDHHVLVVIDHPQARYGRRGRGLGSCGGFRQLNLEPLPFVQTVALAGLRAIERDSSLGRELGGARAAEAEQPRQSCIHAFALEALRHRQGANVTHRAERRRPSNSTPMSDSKTMPPAEQVMAAAARLNTGECWGWMKSTTCPWNGWGALKMRSVRLPPAPPSSPPRQTAQAREPRCRLVRTMTTGTATAMSVKTQVVPVPSEKAAPGLRVYVMVTQLPMPLMSSRVGMKWTTRSLLSWSRIQTTSATANTSEVRLRAGRTVPASSGAALAPGSALGSVDMRCPGSHGSPPGTDG